MKSKAELEKDILNITMKIHREFPELSKFLKEMPENFSGENNQISTKDFKEYYESLEELIAEYSKTHSTDKEDQNLEGYPHYPSSEDIYRQEEKLQDVSSNDISKMKTTNPPADSWNELDFEEDVSGEDLDVPGSELDDMQESIGSEDEENNYYSLGGDNHDDLEEDTGDQFR